MNKRLRSIVFFLLVVTVSLPHAAQNIVFHHLSTTKGLSNYSVMAVYQDPKGLIWMGTRNGVNVYDGNDVTVYKHDQHNPYSIGNNFVRDITGDGNGTVFFRTLRGVSAFDPKTERFTTLIDNNVSAFFYADRLYIAVDNIIYAYSGGRFELVYSLPMHGVQITSLYIDDRQMAIGTREKGCFLLQLKPRKLEQLFSDVEVTTVFRDKKKRFWIGTMNNGLYLYDATQLQHFDSHDGLCANYVRDICEDKLGNIWVGTFRGLNQYLPESRSFAAYENTSRDMHNLSTSVWSLLCDQQGNIWVGTYFGGVDYFTPRQSVYRHYIASNQEGIGLSVPIVGDMTEDAQHNIWIATDGGGLNCFNPRTERFTWYGQHAGGNSISQNNVKTVLYDRQRNCLWIGTHMGGLNKLDLKTRQFTNYRHQQQASHKSNIVCDIVQYKNHLLLATHDGVYLFNPETGAFAPMFKDGHEGDIITLALDLCIDHKGTLWIAGAEKGAYAYDFLTRKLKLYRHNRDHINCLSSNGINSIYEDAAHRLWFCTSESGIDLWEEGKGFTNFNEADNELLSNCVYGACSDKSNKLYIITDKGLSILNVATRQITNYAVGKSLPLTAVTPNAIYLSSTGRMYIGGVGGLIAFSPNQLTVPLPQYQIFPHKLYINSRQVEVGDDTGILSQSLSATGKLTLNSSQAMIGIQYAVTNYTSFSQDKILYRLEGFSKEWATMRSSNFVTYTNLEAGDYQLVVKAVGPDGREHIMSRMDIRVNPVWYLSWWAYLIYIIVVLGLAWRIISAYKHRMDLQAQLKYERNYVKSIEELNQAKLRFFTNISHEFRTPLTIIIGQMEMLLQVKTIAPMVYNKILRTYKSCLQLQELINELLDFRKQEQGKMMLKVGEYNIVNFIHATYLMFQEYASNRNINFHFNKSNDNITVWYDDKQLQKVLNNLLSNAFKFTPDGGEISLSVAKRGQEVVVEVTDNGCGIPKEEQPDIFKRFYQSESAQTLKNTGSGIGLALAKGIVELHHGTVSVISDEGEGATFSFTLPLGNSHFDPEEIIKDKAVEYVVQSHVPTKEIEVLEQDAANVAITEDEEKRFNIVIVEDDETLRQMLSDLFAPYYNVYTATDGDNGLVLVRDAVPDLVLSDVLLKEGGMNGISLCREIKRNVETCQIPVVLLTACTNIEYKLEGIQMGADDYITKPFDINLLLARCKNLVNTRIALQEKYSKRPQEGPQMIATNPLDKKFVEQAMQVIEKHLGDTDFNMNDFAKEMYIARTKLFTKLKAITNQTPNEFILTVRLQRAAIMLKNNPEYNITDVSAITGFSSPRYFTHCFKAKYGMTPQAYRRKDDLS